MNDRPRVINVKVERGLTFAFRRDLLYRTSFHLSKHVKITKQWKSFIYLFTSFSGLRPAQRECARTGLRSHARCHPYPIPQPVEVGHTTGVYDPYSFRIVMWVLLRPTRTNQWKCCETGPTVFRPYPRRLESLTVCRCHYKGSTFFSVILKTVSVGPAGVRTRYLPLSRPALSQLS